MITRPNCHKRNCIFLQGVKQLGVDEEKEVVYCPAFPNGIPERIAYGNDLHEKVSDDQVGDIVFEKENG